VQHVQRKRAAQVALLSMTATSVGLDFSCASRVIFAEVPQTVDVLQQAEARAHRAKARAAVNTYVLLCQRTADVRAWLRLSESLERCSTVIETDYTGARAAHAWTFPSVQ
jgi:SNF2 family DNA or RNA helicase